MEYLLYPDGMVFINREGVPCTLSIGQSVTITDNRGQLFAWHDTKRGTYHPLEFKVTEIERDGGRILLEGMYFMLEFAYRGDAVEDGVPRIREIDGGEYASTRTLYLEERHQIRVWPKRGPKKEE